MRRAVAPALVASLLPLACVVDLGPGDEVTATPSSSLAPALRDAPGGDHADRACTVVLREAAFAGSWRGLVDLDHDAVAAGTSAHVLFRVGDGDWRQHDALATGPGVAGMTRFAFVLPDDLPRPDDVADGADDVRLELVAFARDAGGARAFDHNRFVGDLDNAVLEAENGFVVDDAGVCRPPEAFLSFDADFGEHQTGLLRAGGFVTVHYALERLPTCRGTHNGFPAWDLVATARFLPGGQIVEGSVRALGNEMGRPVNTATSQPLTIAIPDDATAVELWFRNFTGAGSSCWAWDSAYGRNYRFGVAPGVDDPRCLDVEQGDGLRREDPRMVVNTPACLTALPDAHRDAVGCELVVDGFGDGYVGHYGIPFEWLVAFLRVGDVGGEVLDVGMWSRFRDRSSGQWHEHQSLGREVEPGLWQAGLQDHAAAFMGPGFVRDVEAFAFFVDVRRPSGTVERLWQSQRGRNFSLADAFALSPTTQSIPYGSIRWAHDDSAVLATRRACR
jgi:hypothetical protein